MASLTMMASFVGGVTAVKRPWNRRRKGLVTAKVSTAQTQEVINHKHAANDEKSNNSRRNVMFAAAAAAVCGDAFRQNAAVAREEPKPGTPGAKKLYAPVCVTMPTARICHK